MARNTSQAVFYNQAEAIKPVHVSLMENIIG